MTWVKLEVGNNWGALFYTYPGERLNAKGQNDAGNALVLKEGLETAVRFPDDWGAVVRLESKPEPFRYFDMGRECRGETKRWGFLWEVHGLPVWIDLESVEVAAGFASRVRESKGVAAREEIPK